MSEIKGDARINLEILGRLGVTVVEIDDEGQWAALLGDFRARFDRRCALRDRSEDGAHRIYETVIADVNTSDLPVVSIDLPSVCRRTPRT